jgi:hypothetical protein
MQIKVSTDAVTEGKGKMFILTESLEVQPSALVAVTIYCTVLAGEATGLFVFGSERFFDGVHEKVFPPLLVVVRAIEEPLHKDVSLIVVTPGKGKTFTVTESVDEQLFLVTVR